MIHGVAWAWRERGEGLSLLVGVVPDLMPVKINLLRQLKLEPGLLLKDKVKDGIIADIIGGINRRTIGRRLIVKDRVGEAKLFKLHNHVSDILLGWFRRLLRVKRVEPVGREGEESVEALAIVHGAHVEYFQLV